MGANNNKHRNRLALFSKKDIKAALEEIEKQNCPQCGSKLLHIEVCDTHYSDLCKKCGYRETRHYI